MPVLAQMPVLVRRLSLFSKDVDPHRLDGVIDLRELKKPEKSSQTGFARSIWMLNGGPEPFTLGVPDEAIWPNAPIRISAAGV